MRPGCNTDPTDTVAVEGPEMTKFWKSSLIWQMSVLHLHILTSQAPLLTVVEESKYVMFSELTAPQLIVTEIKYKR